MNRHLPALVVLTTFLTSTLAAQTPQLLRDVNRTPRPNGSSLPTLGPVFNGHTYLSANSIGTNGKDTGHEMFRTRGLPGTTRLFAEFWSGELAGAPHRYIRVGNLLFFTARRDFGTYLYRTDGTTAGTVELAAVEMAAHAVLQGRLYFFQGTDLWVSDGTVPGTRVLRSFTFSTFPFTPPEIAVFGTRLLLTGGDRTLGAELWVSDGTATGTALLTDLVPGAGSSTPTHFRVVGARAFFLAETPTTGRELFVTDGTAAGTTLVQDIRPGVASAFLGILPDRRSAPITLEVLGNQLLFSADDGVRGFELWRSDGTPQGTVRVLDINTSTSYGGHAAPDEMHSTGSSVFFTAVNSSGRELWISDGTTTGTTQIGPGGSNPDRLFLDGTRLYYRAVDPAAGREPWTSDGTPLGTTLLRDVAPGRVGSDVRGFARSPTGRVLFAANDGVVGSELWETDGTRANTRLLDDIYNPLPGSTQGSNVGHLITAVGSTYFVAQDGQQPGLWRTDGTVAGTRLVRQLDVTGYSGAHLAIHDNRLFFNAQSGAGAELWVTDGTSAGTRMVLDIRPGPGHGDPRQLRSVGGSLFFSADNGATGRELWVSDGTSAGTRLLRDIRAQGSSNPIELTALGNVVLFQAYDDTVGAELWRSDGTPAGTYLVTDLRTGSQGRTPWSAQPHELTRLGNLVYFIANDQPNSSVVANLFRTDGTQAGTARIASGRFQKIAQVGPRLFVTDRSNLYVLDPRAASPTLTTVATYFGDAQYDALTAAGDRLFFVARDPSSPSTSVLWTSDGTASGTAPVRTAANQTVAPVRLRVDGNPLLVAAGTRRVFFTANPADPKEPELWVSDGSASGTRQVHDLRPGPVGSQPVFLVHAHGKLLFGADDGFVGRELWALDVSGARQRAGGGCGATFAPELDSDDPVLGQSMRLELRARPGQSMVVGVGLPSSSPFTLGHCTFSIDYALPQFLLFGRTPVQGAFTSTLPVPNDTALVGFSLVLHAAVDAPSYPPFGAEFSNTVFLTPGR